MAEVRTTSQGSSSSASISCDLCRDKKYRCTREKPRCARCKTAGRPCRYSAPPVRSPLTRIYLTSIEKRVQKLERLIHQLNPEVDIEDALARLDGSQAGDASVPALSRDSSLPESVHLEALPLVAEGFEWQESCSLVDGLADGMAALAVGPAGGGYLGSTSGAGVLRALLSKESPKSVPDANQLPHLQHFQNTPDDVLTNLQLAEQLHTQQTVDFLVDTYFHQYHTSYPFIHEASFRAVYNGLLPKPAKPVYQILIYMILATGAWTIGNGCDWFDDYFYQKAISYTQQHAIFEAGSLPMVQALLLLSNYVQKRNMPNTSSNYLGLAVRNALSLGIHRELADWQIGLLEKEIRRRVWWTLYIFDSGTALMCGRHILLPEDDDVKMVANLSDELLTPMTSILPPELETPTIYSSLKYQAQFRVLTNVMCNRLLSQPTPTAKETLAMLTSLNELRTKWPLYFQPKSAPVLDSGWYMLARADLEWRALVFELSATRPFLIRWVKRCTDGKASREKEDEFQCRQACINAAHGAIESIQQYANSMQMPRLHAWYAAHFMFHAALVPILSIRADPISPQAIMWNQDITTVRWLCQTVFVNHALGKRALNAINQLIPQFSPAGEPPMQFDFADPTFQSWFPRPMPEDQLQTQTPTTNSTD